MYNSTSVLLLVQRQQDVFLNYHLILLLIYSIGYRLSSIVYQGGK